MTDTTPAPEEQTPTEAAAGADLVKIDVSGSPQAGPFSVSDGINAVDYKPSKGVVRVAPGHVGAVLGALPGSVVIED